MGNKKKAKDLNEWEDLDQIAAALGPLLAEEESLEAYNWGNMPYGYGEIGSKLDTIEHELREDAGFYPSHGGK